MKKCPPFSLQTQKIERNQMTPTAGLLSLRLHRQENKSSATTKAIKVSISQVCKRNVNLDANDFITAY